MVVTARTALEGLWSLADCDCEALERIELTGEEPALPSVFPIGTAASACIGVAGLAASELWRKLLSLHWCVAISPTRNGPAVRKFIQTGIHGP